MTRCGMNKSKWIFGLGLATRMCAVFVQKNFKNEAKRSFRINKMFEKWDKTKPMLGLMQYTYL
jgi:hypothetical protein